MARETAKGTVTPLSSLIPTEEAQRAALRVQHAIADREKELDRLRTFIADNSSLIALVQRLPDLLSHDIMVPFGSAAFFPGRLIHTNELTVLLGEGYYAERTAKQTVEILQRREKALESQVEALKANVLDLEAEAKFFDSTAAEAAEGLVEIWEEYVEEPKRVEPELGVPQSKPLESSKADDSKMSDEDAEYAQIMATFDELEKDEEEEDDDGEEEEEEEEDEDEEQEEEETSEEEAESSSGNNEDVDAETVYDFTAIRNCIDENGSQTFVKEKSRDPVQMSKDQEHFVTSAAKPTGISSHTYRADQSSVNNLTASDISFIPNSYLFTLDHLYLLLDYQLIFNSYMQAMDLNMQLAAKGSSKSRTEPTDPFSSELKDNLRKLSDRELEVQQDSSQSVASQTSKKGFDGAKAFTGSIVEHAHGLLPRQSTKTSISDKPSDSNSVKPVSRFKMQRGNR